MKDIITVLNEAKIFRNITIANLQKIYPFLSGNVKKYLKDEVAIAEEDEVNFVGIVLNGEFSIKKLFSDGSQILLQKAASPYILGIDIVCTRFKTSPYSVFANETSEIFIIPFHVFSKPGTIDEEIRLSVLENILTLISHENFRKLHTIEVLAKRGLRERIMVYLTRQKKKYNSSSFTISLNREQLAEYLSVNRSALSHELSLMQQEGLIKVHGFHFTIIDNLKI